MLTRLGRVIRVTALVGALYAARRYYRNWGATKDECQMRLPGDELVGAPVVQTTEAVSIDAPPAAIWPWLLQLGQDRAGFYGPQLPARLLGLQWRNAGRLHPEWQHRAPGDQIRVTPDGWLGRADGLTFTVVAMVPEERLVLKAELDGRPWAAVWSFHLLPHWNDRSRLLVRVRSGLRHPGEVLGMELTRPVVTLGLRAMLRGIKRRAEVPATVR